MGNGIDERGKMTGKLFHIGANEKVSIGFVLFDEVLPLACSDLAYTRP